METKELDLGSILEDCPRGTKLYSPVFGTVEFDHINDIDDQIWVNYTDKDNELASTYFSTDGRFEQTEDSECCLFPSKGNRDWSTFEVPKAKVEHFDPNTLKPFDKVLAKDGLRDPWYISLFGFINPNDNVFPYTCMNMLSFKYIIPYNDDTKHLVGTADKAPEYYRYWEE